MNPKDLFSNQGRRNDFPYYRRVWARVVLTLLTASLLPLIVIGGGVSSYTLGKIESQALDALNIQVRSHQQAIDRFLSEREHQLRLIAATQSAADLVAPGRLASIFAYHATAIARIHRPGCDQSARASFGLCRPLCLAVANL